MQFYYEIQTFFFNYFVTLFYFYSYKLHIDYQFFKHQVSIIYIIQTQCKMFCMGLCLSPVVFNYCLCHLILYIVVQCVSQQFSIIKDVLQTILRVLINNIYSPHLSCMVICMCVCSSVCRSSHSGSTSQTTQPTEVTLRRSHIFHLFRNILILKYCTSSTDLSCLINIVTIHSVKKFSGLNDYFSCCCQIGTTFSSVYCEFHNEEEHCLTFFALS